MLLSRAVEVVNEILKDDGLEGIDFVGVLATAEGWQVQVYSEMNDTRTPEWTLNDEQDYDMFWDFVAAQAANEEA